MSTKSKDVIRNLNGNWNVDLVFNTKKLIKYIKRSI